MEFLEENWSALKKLILETDEDLPLSEARAMITRVVHVIENILVACLTMLLIVGLGYTFVEPLFNGFSWWHKPALIFAAVCILLLGANVVLVVKRYVGARRILNIWGMAELIYFVAKDGNIAEGYKPFIKQLIDQIVSAS